MRLLDTLYEKNKEKNYEVLAYCITLNKIWVTRKEFVKQVNTLKRLYAYISKRQTLPT